MSRCKIFASDEGFGHLVRQQAISEALLGLAPDLDIDLQTDNNADAASWLFPQANVIRRFNNILWPRHASGSPDLERTRAFYADYLARSDQFLEQETVADYDFLISDFVYEAFPLGHSGKIPTFGVAHFTWDWFFSKLYPSPVRDSVLGRWREHAQLADVLFFSEFSPVDIIEYYKHKAFIHPLIVRRALDKNIVKRGEFNVLIMDSGANILTNSISKAVNEIHKLPDFHFFVSDKFSLDVENVTGIPRHEPVINYLSHMDLVIARGGFNLISECIGYRVPLLLLGEISNPEVERNMFFLKHQGLGSYISLDRFTNHFAETLQRFVEGEYRHIRTNMTSHDLRTDGAMVVADRILNHR